MTGNARLSALFGNYASYHKTQGNRFCHLLGIPMIMVSLLGLLGHKEGALIRVDPGTLLLTFATAWYLTLNWRLAIPFSSFAYGTYFLGRAIPTAPLLILFVLGWALQILGHKYYEKNSPAFFNNLKHFFIGPLWIFARCLGHSSTPSEKILD